MKNTDQLNILFQKYLNQRCSPEEMKQLMDYFANSDTDDGVLGNLVDQVLNEQNPLSVDVETRQKLDLCFENIRANKTTSVAKRIRLKPIYVRWTIAASLFIAACTTFLYFTQTSNMNTGQHPVAQVKLKPGTDRARLTLGDGTVIDLEQAGNGKLKNNGGIGVTKTADGKLVYDAKNEASVIGAIAYNTLVTPRGGQYKVILPDGSSIWLNAASSLRFPTRFVGAERRVELSGEGYFEIKKNEKQPFIVVSARQEVTVLGTHFNINAYSENNMIKTTLIEGAVKVRKGEHSYVLAPGQESHVDNSNNEILIEKNVDLDAVIAWKNGRFSFDETNIKEVMQQIARWYDVDVLYKGDFSSVVLTGDIPRGADASRVLNLLKGTKQVDFIINGRVITVIPFK